MAYPSDCCILYIKQRKDHAVILVDMLHSDEPGLHLMVLPAPIHESCVVTGCVVDRIQIGNEAHRFD